MKTDKVETIDYKLLYYDLKNKYDKISMELEELKIDNKLKEEEINILRKKLHSNLHFNLNINSLENKDSSSIKGDDNNLFNENNNSILKQSNKKYDTYSVDSFRNDLDQGNDLLQELMKNEIDDINIQRINNYKKILKIEKNNFEILSKKSSGDKNNINRALTGDIDAILLNIKMKQQSLHQTQKMFNFQNNK